MSNICWILMTFIIAVNLEMAEATTCCLTKKVGGVTYTLISLRDTSSYNCLTDCIYKTSTLGSLYCFGSGTDESECIDTTTSTASTIPTLTATTTKTATGSSSKYCQNDFVYTRYGEWKTSKAFLSEIPWKCIYEVPKWVYKCIEKHGTHVFDVIKCIEAGIPSECTKYLCYYLGKVSPAAKAICTCIVEDDLFGIAEECRKENSDSWVDTVECIVAKTPINCISSLCGILEKVFPEIPEIGPICTCGAEIVVALDKCHMEYKPDWEKIAECTVEAAAKDCKKYVCKFAGKIFPPILKTKLCKT